MKESPPLLTLFFPLVQGAGRIWGSSMNWMQEAFREFWPFLWWDDWSISLPLFASFCSSSNESDDGYSTKHSRRKGLHSPLQVISPNDEGWEGQKDRTCTQTPDLLVKCKSSASVGPHWDISFLHVSYKGSSFPIYRHRWNFSRYIATRKVLEIFRET